MNIAWIVIITSFTIKKSPERKKYVVRSLRDLDRLYNFKNVKNTHEGELLELLKLGVYSELNHTSKIQLFAKIFNG